MITFEMTPQERFLIMYALTAAEEKLKDEPGFEELMVRFSQTSCGSPGCSYCDPQPENWD